MASKLFNNYSIESTNFCQRENPSEYATSNFSASYAFRHGLLVLFLVFLFDVYVLMHN